MGDPAVEWAGEDRQAGVSFRRFPYPYQAMLAICSDLDETPDSEAYFTTAEYLNTTRTTAMGPGVGLEVGNTIYFDMPPDQFAYWNTDDAGRAKVRELIRSGHIDCLHSFGDLAVRRSDAARALEELERQGCRLQVWIDHGSVPTNFGPDIMRGSGDVPGSEAFHADLTWQFGVRYVWCGRVTSVTAQDVPRRLRGIFTREHQFASARTLAKEYVKGLEARRGSTKYAPHAANALLWPVALRSGHDVLEFLRANPSWGGVSHHDTGWGVGEVLTDTMLARLVARRGVMVLYTHLGKTRGHGMLPESARRGFERLARWSREQHILVSTTRRVLGYSRAVGALSIWTAREGGRLVVDLRTRSDAGKVPLERSDFDGVTVYVPEPGAIVTIDGTPVPVKANPADELGKLSLSIPWSRLEFPVLNGKRLCSSNRTPVSMRSDINRG